ncbi:hypothetical protein [Desertivirga arenae]|uniref:hypothetical protein n=1 Tax=Desertivirga arenae TaxID=2810309 RepID=UPI001A96A0C3|nr:hypothetical protein [Pedobacter sp. SYSU D00823]
MYLVQILLPLYNNSGQEFSSNYYSVVRKELVDKFGGITTYTRSPATGLWKEKEDKTVKDDIVIFELMVQSLDREWWSCYKFKLAKLFEQEVILVRSWEVSIL